ncbi:MAG: hypothetical protein Q8N69_01665 [bacterium]|nr:hypothetical protein [bacterium]
MALTFDDLKKLAEKKEPEPNYSHEAVQRLSGDGRFDKLRGCKTGKDFMWELREVFSGMKYGRIHGNITQHTIIGICQLAHDIRDQVGPANRKSFNRLVIPWLLERKKRVTGSKPPENVVEYMCQEIENLDQPKPSDWRPEAGSVALPGLSDWFRGYQL